MRSTIFLALILFLSTCHISNATYAAGDPIPMSKRSQYAGYTSGASEVLFNDCPRYLYPRALNWHSVIDAPNYDSTKPFKIQLTFDQGGRFRTPWITVADGRGRYLSTLIFKFRSDGGEIQGFSYETVYSHEATKEIRIQHKWTVSEDNIVGGVTAFVLVGFLALFILSSASVSHWNSMVSAASYKDSTESGETLDRAMHYKGV